MRYRNYAAKLQAKPQAARQSDSLAALALMLLLVVIGLYLIDTLRDGASVQDCVLSGRSLCQFARLP